MNDRYHLIIRQSPPFDAKRDFVGDILVDAYDISLVCAYNIIKLYGNRVQLKRLEVNDGKELQP